MDNSFTLKEVFLMMFGFGYRANHNRKEIHRLRNKHKNCNHAAMSKNTSEYVTYRRAKKLIEKYNYNGCRWCWKTEDKG